jgi:hypothetical protein
MQNIEVKVDKNKLILTVDLTKRGGPSTSGKTIIVASTQGNAKVEGHAGIQFGLNVFAKPDGSGK